MIIKRAKQHNNFILINGFVKIFILLFLFFINICSAFALDDAKLTESIDSAFQRQSEDQLNKILIENNDAENYAAIEAYILKKTRDSLIFNRLEYALFASLTLIDNNLDNFDALNLYSRISEVIDIRNEKKAEEESIRISNLREEQTAAELVRDKLEEEFQQVTTAEGQKVYFEDDSKARYTSFDWSVSIGIGLNILSTPSITSVKSGIAAGGYFYYYGDTIAIGGEASVVSYMLTFTGAENFITDFKVIPAISFLDLSRNLFFRFGFRGIFTDPTQDGTSVSKFLSPVVGVEWKKIPIGITKSDVYIDYLFGHLTVPEIKTAMDIGIKTLIPLSNQGNFSIGLLIEFSDTLMVSTSGIENHAKLTFSIGVGNYE